MINERRSSKRDSSLNVFLGTTAGLGGRVVQMGDRASELIGSGKKSNQMATAEAMLILIKE